MEFIMAWKWWFIATVLVAVGITICAAIGHRRTQRLIATRAGAGGGGVNPQPPTAGAAQPTLSGGIWRNARLWLNNKLASWKAEAEEVDFWEDLWRNWLAFPVVMLLLISIVSGIVRFVFPPLAVGEGTNAYTVRWWLWVFFGLTAWLFSRKENIEPDQWGVKKFFGRIVQDFGQGPTLMPPGPFAIARYPIMQHSIQIGGKETKSTLALLAGVVPQEVLQSCQDLLSAPLEVNFATSEEAKWTLDYQEDELLDKPANDPERIKLEAEISQRKREHKNDPLNARLTAKMRVTFIVQIDRKHIREFAENIKSPDRAILELNELARAVVSRWCGKRTAAFVSRNLGLLGREILFSAEDRVGDNNPTKLESRKRRKLPDGSSERERVVRRREHVNPKPWGLDIIMTEVHALELPVEVKTSVDSIAKNIADAQATSKLADGEKAKRAKWGIGDARAVQAMNIVSSSPAGKYNVAMKTLVDMMPKGKVVFSNVPGLPAMMAQIKEGFDDFQPSDTQQQPKTQQQATPQTQPPKGGTK